MEVDEPSASSEDDAREVEYKAYLLLGYTRSLEDKVDQGPAVPAAYVPKILGMHDLDKSVWARRDIQPLVQFALAFGSKKTPPSDFWDLSKSNQMPVTTLRRFKALRYSRVNTLVRSVSWDHRKGRASSEVQQAVPVYWFAADHGEGWRIGCHSAAHALMLSRMPDLHTPTALAHALVTQCLQFQTWVEIAGDSIDHIVHPASDRFIKFRHRLSEFTQVDYETYLHNRTAMLSGPRGRAALMRGGIISKFAQETVSLIDVLSGPSEQARSGRGIVRHNGHGGYLVDDCLLEEEEEAICGHYDTYGK